MPLVKSLSVGLGDMYYINHGSDNFTVIDCCLSDDNRERITQEIKTLSSQKGITRFISTHPDEDHIKGLAYFEEKVGIYNFYCVRNTATKPDESDSFQHYCGLRDGSKAFYIHKGCKRKWMNENNEERGSSGLSVLWPDTADDDFQTALFDAAAGTSFNNISPVIRYKANDSGSMLWIGDLATDFMDSVTDKVNLSKTDVVFAPHHGRHSGKIPNSWLDKLRPEVIVIGEAPSRHLNYYTGYDALTQNSAWDIIFDFDGEHIDIYVDNPNYKPNGNFLINRRKYQYNNYIGSVAVGGNT
jgi:beta-lactamase superfamily II metal-dependent hydrolase